MTTASPPARREEALAGAPSAGCGRIRPAQVGEGERERGSATVELVLLTPLLVLVLLFVVALGRLVSARIQVQGAAAQAARAASLARDPTTATAAAQQTAEGTLTDQHRTCTTLSVDTDTSRFAAGGTVAVTVRCTVNLADLSGLRLPTSQTVIARSVQPIDTYRATTP